MPLAKTDAWRQEHSCRPVAIGEIALKAEALGNKHDSDDGAVSGSNQGR